VQHVITIIFLLFSYSIEAVPVKDNILFAFEKCKELGIDLDKGQLKESISSSFDMVCHKISNSDLEFNCDYFETGSSRKLTSESFKGGSDLGIAELKSKSGKRLKFLIGKQFASFESSLDHKVCVGIYLFEQDALKKKTTR
jgi:hypothetical protein